MKQKLLFICMCLFFTGLYSQFKWTEVSSKNNSQKDLQFRKSIPTDYKVYSLDLFQPKNTAFSMARDKSEIIELPTEKGIQNFSLEEVSNFAPELSAKFPMIKSYIGKGIDDTSSIVRLSMGTDGLHAVVYTANHPSFYIDPHTKDKKEYIVYSRKNIPKKDSDFQCKVERQSKENKREVAPINANDGLLRTYRLALACTGEYAQYHLRNQGIASSETDAIKKAAVLSAMNTSIHRINGIYERELGVRMEIVANNDKIIFLDADTDELSNSEGPNLIEESQSKCDTEIGSGNYDIGHTFSTAGGGLAGLGVVCVTGQKGRGVTGSEVPKGPFYDIDYVAHEIGHQFGANHTFNGDESNCSGGNRNDNTAVEPGSGSTIMSYAGICGSQNVQNNSNEYFHAVSIHEMWTTIQYSATCGSAKNTGNTAPIAKAGLDYTVPKSTPLVLKGIGSDVNSGDVLTYNWEQIDTEITTIPPVSTSKRGSLFRSKPSSTSPNRYLPALTTVLVGDIASAWEVIPSVAREMNFSLTVRDNNTDVGNSARDDMKVTVDGNSGPFKVTSQEIATTWYSDTTQTVTWNVADTDLGTVNTEKVTILLSIDGGFTYPYTLATATENDGAQEIIVPEINGYTSRARIMVEANDNIFYAVNKINFKVVGEIVINPNDISVTTTSESCVGLEDGIITVETKQSLDYSITVNGGVTSLYEKIYGVGKKLFTAIVPGTYKVCVEVGIVNYRQCFEVTIGKSEDIALRVSAKGEQSRVYAFEIDTGTAPFEVLLNDKLVHTSNNSSFNLEIQQSGKLEVKTAKSCEGTFTSSINNVFLMQNPVKEYIQLNLPLGLEKTYIDVTIFDINGKIALKQSVKNEGNNLQIPFNNFKHGIYVLNLGIENVKPIKFLK